MLGGDHSLSLPTLRVLTERFGPDGYAVVHFDTHADTAAELYGVRISHGTPFRVAVEEGYLDGHNIVQLGLRGTWPGPEDLAWMRAQGFRWHTMDEIDTRGLERILDDIVSHMRGRAKRIYLTVDIDVLDPAFAPGTGTPEPGGLTTRELRGALRRIAAELDALRGRTSSRSARRSTSAALAARIAIAAMAAASTIGRRCSRGLAARRGGAPRRARRGAPCRARGGRRRRLADQAAAQVPGGGPM